MRLLVFQHLLGEHPAAFGDLASAAGDAVTVVRLDLGESIPNLDNHDALLVMGGPMDVWQTDDFPWLVDELRAINRWVSADRPFLGICLGHQLLATAMGGECGPMANPEIGIMPIDSGLPGLAGTFPALQWHGTEVKHLPPGASVLASNEACAVQAIGLSRSIGVQFHPEITNGLVPTWLKDPPNMACANDWLGSSRGVDSFVSQSEAHVPSANLQAAALYNQLGTCARKNT